MIDPEVGQAVMVHRNPAGEPAIGDVAFAQPRQLPRRANPFHGRVEPQRQKHRRVRRRPPGFARPRLDRIVEWIEVQTLDECPNHPRPMIGHKQTLKVDQVPAKLSPIRPNHPRLAANHRRPRFIPSGDNESQTITPSYSFTGSFAGTNGGWGTRSHSRAASGWAMNLSKNAPLARRHKGMAGARRMPCGYSAKLMGAHRAPAAAIFFRLPASSAPHQLPGLRP